MFHTFHIYKKSYQLHRGFTLLEMLLVMGVLIALAAISMPMYNGYRTTVEAEEEIGKIRSTLRSAQGKASAFEENSQWGVRFTNPASGVAPFYEFFQGASYPGTIKETTYLSPRLMFQSPSSGTTQDVVFEKRSGKSTSVATITIIVKPRSGNVAVKSVLVTREGNIQVQ